MADDKTGRDKQAHDAERRRRTRDLAVELERGDETEPPLDVADIDLGSELDGLSFPAAGTAVIAAVGDHEVASAGDTYVLADLLPAVDDAQFDSPAGVRARVQRPTVAAAMKRIVEASDPLPATLSGSQREAYEKTIRALASIDAVDDEGVGEITDWIVEQIRRKESLPGSRAVRRQAAKLCRNSGYQVRDDEWLGV